MIEVRKTKAFLRWLEGLRDLEAQGLIMTRMVRLARGNAGSHRVLDGGIVELKIDHGAGYRLYYVRIGKTRLLLLRGGDKRTQKRDIERARIDARKRGEDDAT